MTLRSSRARAALTLVLTFALPRGASAADPPGAQPPSTQPPAAQPPAAAPPDAPADAPAPPAEWLDPPPDTPSGDASPDLPASAPEDAPAGAPGPGSGRAPAPEVARPGPRIQVHHRPISTAVAARDLRIRASVGEVHLVHRVLLLHRAGSGALEELPMLRGESGFQATIPAEAAREGLAYAIEVELGDGTRVAAFASRDALHPVQLLPDAMDEREARLLSRLEGRRSVVSAGAEIADFGPTPIEGVDARDSFWRVEGRYVYRPLRTVAEIGIRGGVVRGTSPRSDGAGPIENEVGLNYGAPSVRLRMADLWHAELEGLASITDEGFSTGGGASLLIGDPYGSKLTLGASFVGVTEETYFGSRFHSRLDLAVHERVTVSPVIEVTDMPNAERFGVRLLADVGVALGSGWSLNGHGGYQARIAASGGPSGGGTLSLAF